MAFVLYNGPLFISEFQHTFEIFCIVASKRSNSHHKSGVSNGWLGVRNAQEDRYGRLDLVHVGHPRALELGHSRAVVEVDEEPVDPPVVGVDGHVSGKVLASRTAFTLKSDQALKRTEFDYKSIAADFLSAVQIRIYLKKSNLAQYKSLLKKSIKKFKFRNLSTFSNA